MKTIKTKKGFTLVEVIVAISIFALIMTTAVVSFANLFGSYRKAKNLQEDLDNAQYAINLISKSMRTSTIVGAGSGSGVDSIEIYDYSQDLCVEYRFLESSGKEYLGTRYFVADGPEGCGSHSGDYDFMTSGSVRGKFWFEQSEEGKVGYATILMNVGEANEPGGVDIQSTVSLRDYGVSGLTIDTNTDSDTDGE